MLGMALGIIFSSLRLRDPKLAHASKFRKMLPFWMGGTTGILLDDLFIRREAHKDADRYIKSLEDGTEKKQ